LILASPSSIRRKRCRRISFPSFVSFFVVHGVLVVIVVVVGVAVVIVVVVNLRQQRSLLRRLRPRLPTARGKS